MRAFRKFGCQVQSLAAVGKGCPDLLIAARGALHLVEVKDGNKPPSAQQLTPDQTKWHKDWGCVHIVRSVDEVVELVEEWAA